MRGRRRAGKRVREWAKEAVTRANERGREGSARIDGGERANGRRRQGRGRTDGGGGKATARTFSLTTGSSQGVMMRQNGWNTQGAL